MDTQTVVLIVGGIFAVAMVIYVVLKSKDHESW